MSTTAHAFMAIVALGCVVFMLRLLRRRQMKVKYAFLWLTVGLAMLLLAASPAILDRTSAWLGIAYGPTTLFLVALVLLLLVCVQFSWEVSRLEERTRVLAEEIAILRAERDSAGR